jgi:hypothetical protein
MSTESVETGDQQDDGQFEACVHTPNVDEGAKLEESHIEAHMPCCGLQQTVRSYIPKFPFACPPHTALYIINFILL